MRWLDAAVNSKAYWNSYVVYYAYCNGLDCITDCISVRGKQDCRLLWERKSPESSLQHNTFGGKKAKILSPGFGNSGTA